VESPEAGILTDGGEHLQSLFGQLRDAYGSLYAREHAAFYKSREAVTLSRAAERALEALSALAAVDTLDRPAGLETFLRERAEGDRQQCRRRLSEELLRSPLCGCGFAMGDSAAPRRQEAPDAAIDRFLAAYCVILATPRVMEAVAARAFALQDVKSAGAARLKKLSDILRRGGMSPAELASAIDAETASELGRALAGRIPIRSRSLADLEGKLAGRRLPARAILSIVTEWLQETSDDALISVEADVTDAGSAGAGLTGAGRSAAPGAGSSQAAGSGAQTPGAGASGVSGASLWPLLHGELFARLRAPGSSAAEQAAHWGKVLEAALPSAVLRDAFVSAGSPELSRFIQTERLHTAAIRAAWLVLAERIVEGQPLPSGMPAGSRHVDPGLARRIADLLAVLSRAADLLGRPYPDRLVVRLAFEELLFDPWTTEELSSAVYRSIEQVSQGADTWLQTLPPVRAIPLAESPVVLIADGVPADVWMAATAAGWNEGVLAGHEASWARLESAPSTQPSIASLFSLAGDPQEQLGLRDIPFLTLKGIEERSLNELLLPLSPGKPAVARLTLFDQAAHARRLRLSEMAAALGEIAARDLPALIRECARSKRELILTTDHGLSLTREGLAHGRGGAYERLIFRARWASGHS